ncbi:hypothetical protein AB205_0068550 [Aquarana catesbeiana]|uniref:Uncharacterized protein n=1 Tax=Aquarana catesbeiana TaxID=8400 RepID=A0A2G9RVI1_AQUCT|nr:hypothetical protein AB205_0068550 [Aquarana catesbeiana]
MANKDFFLCITWQKMLKTVCFSWLTGRYLTFGHWITNIDCTFILQRSESPERALFCFYLCLFLFFYWVYFNYKSQFHIFKDMVVVYSYVYIYFGDMLL